MVYIGISGLQANLMCRVCLVYELNSMACARISWSGTAKCFVWMVLIGSSDGSDGLLGCML